MSIIRRLISAGLAVLMLSCTLLPAAASAESTRETTILFTHDLHSHFLPVETDDGGQSGGYARLATVIRQEKQEHPHALLLDGGDFSIGSLIQTLYTSRATELRTMGALGYDATTLGNHEFDHESTGLVKMLQAAYTSGDTLPAVLLANYRPSAENPAQLDIQRTMAAYGMKESMIFERGGVKVGVFGLMGLDAHDCAPGSGFSLEDPIKAAERCVDKLEEQGAELIVCLSHGGTDEKSKKSEDEQLAKKVDGIDVIISGHTHTTLEEPVLVEDTYIVSSGPYCENLGSMTLSWEKGSQEKQLVDYELIPIDETVKEDASISAMVGEWKKLVGAEYLGRYGLSYDQVLTRTSFDLKTPEYGVQQGNALGELVADSFLWAVENLEENAPDVTTVAVTADGVLRANLMQGDITASMAFDVLSMGVGSDGTSGYPLVGVYLTGKELKAAAEVDASVTPIMPAAQLYMAGMEYKFNTNRMFFNRVTDTCLESGGEIQDDQLYRVVTGMYSAKMLGTVKSKSMGLLSLEPKMADGSPVTDYNDCILYDKNGNEIKDWYALAAYLSSFGKEGVSAGYQFSDGRKQVSHSFNPTQLVKNLNWISFAALAAILLLIVIVVFVVRKVFRRLFGRRYGGQYRG